MFRCIRIPNGLACYHFFVFSMLLEILNWYFKGRLEELSTIMSGEFNDDGEIQDKAEISLNEKSKVSYRVGQMEIDECYHQGMLSENNKLVKNIGKVVRDLRSLGFTSMTEDAYASAIFLLLKVNMCYNLVLFPKFSLSVLYLNCSRLVSILRYLI